MHSFAAFWNIYLPARKKNTQCQSILHAACDTHDSVVCADGMEGWPTPTSTALASSAVATAKGRLVKHDFMNYRYRFNKDHTRVTSNQLLVWHSMARGWGETLSLRRPEMPFERRLSELLRFWRCCRTSFIGHGMARMGHDGTHGTKSRYKIFKMIQMKSNEFR